MLSVIIFTGRKILKKFENFSKIKELLINESKIKKLKITKEYKVSFCNVSHQSKNDDLDINQLLNTPYSKFRLE